MHLTHIGLAVVAVAAGLLHMVGWGFLLSCRARFGSGLTIFWIALLLYVRILKPLFILRRPYRVTEVRPERGDTWTLGHASGRSSRLSLQAWPARLAHSGGSPFKITAHPFSFSSSAAAGRRAG